MDIRFGAQAHPLGGLRLGDQEYAPLTGNAAGYMAAAESGLDTFEAEAEPTIQAAMAAVETDYDALAADGISSLSQTMQAVEDATPDELTVFGTITQGSLRFGGQTHPMGGLRFGSQSWAALGPNGPLEATEAGADTAAAAGWLVPAGYQYAAYTVQAAFVSYGTDSLGSSITGTLDDGNVVLLPVAATGIAFAWEVNEFGAPSLRLASLTGAEILDDVPWFVWDGATWTTAALSVSNAMQGAAFLVETGLDIFSAAGAGVASGAAVLVEVGDDSAEIIGAVAVRGTMAAAESGDDVLAATGFPGYAGIMAANEDIDAPDVLESSGDVAVSGDLGATEAGTDVFAAVGVRTSSGDLAATESGSDTMAAAGRLSSTGTMAATEASTADTAEATGTVRVSGVLSATEAGADAFEAAGSAARTGTLAANEAGADTAAVDGEAAISGAVAAAEAGADLLTATGEAPREGIVTIVELVEGGGDRFVARGFNGTPPPVPDFDGPVTVGSGSARYTITSRKQTPEAA